MKDVLLAKVTSVASQLISLRIPIQGLKSEEMATLGLVQPKSEAKDVAQDKYEVEELQIFLDTQKGQAKNTK